MKITDIIDFSRTHGEIIAQLSDKSAVDVKPWSQMIQLYEPSLHRIMTDNAGRQGRETDDGHYEPPSRIALPMERLLVNRIKDFMFSIPVQRNYYAGNLDPDRFNEIKLAMEAIYKTVRIDAQNLKRAEAYFASCEMATMWYLQPKPNNLYGFPSQYKLRCKTYSPMDGVELYPLFDEYDDLIAMSFSYTKAVGKRKITYFETFTAENHFVWFQDGGEWVRVENEAAEVNSIGKIPVAYASRPEPFYYPVVGLRDEIEYALSRNSDVVAYNAAPMVMVAGEIEEDNERKGNARRFVKVENGGSVEYVSWSQSIDATKYHIETMLSQICKITQMPDISAEKMAALGNIGYDARKTIFTDAHMKVGDEAGPIIEFLERECNVVKAFLAQLRPDWATDLESIEVEQVITPYIQEDETARIERLQKANGGKPVMSQLESIRQAGYSDDPEETLNQIAEEDSLTKSAMQNDLFSQYS